MILYRSRWDDGDRASEVPITLKRAGTIEATHLRLTLRLRRRWPSTLSWCGESLACRMGMVAVLVGLPRGPDPEEQVTLLQCCQRTDRRQPTEASCWPERDGRLVCTTRRRSTTRPPLIRTGARHAEEE